ncbi:hypothetical protein [Nisaea sp.]|jgi:hypothetical protein|uniref:Uncharacterized protein n=1 Tax=Qipengyuania vulgaris TaxID=291985 RepID=A0A844XPE6_9SPHN|nr:hypothetical protein [Qipengyuania vulgaris]
MPKPLVARLLAECLIGTICLDKAAAEQRKALFGVVSPVSTYGTDWRL